MKTQQNKHEPRNQQAKTFYNHDSPAVGDKNAI